MSSLQRERDSLLRYALQHPPSNVTVVLPPNAKSIDDLDLSQCQSPLEFFQNAEQHKSEKFELNLRDSYSPRTVTDSDIHQGALTYEGGSKGGVARPKNDKVHRPGTEATASATDDTSAKSESSEGGLLPSWMNFFSKGISLGSGKKGAGKANKTGRKTASVERPSNDSGAKEESGTPPNQRPRIPLFGTTGGTLADNVEGLVKEGQSAVIPMTRFPQGKDIELCPIFDEQGLVNVLNDNFKVTVYEHILLSTQLLMGYRRSDYEFEIFNIFRPIFGITEEEHMNCLLNLMTSELEELAMKEGAQDEVARYVENFYLSNTNMLDMINCSNDDEFKHRFSTLHDLSVNYCDNGEGMNFTTYPLVVRCVIFAGVLTPTHLLDPQSGKPVAHLNNIFHTVEAVRLFLRIPSDMEPYCHLHSRLLVNNEWNELKRQVSWMRNIVKAVSQLDTSLLRETMTPPVKYGYYVLQETLSVSMTPLPWLDAIDENTVLSATALFIETSSALPPMFISAFVMVDKKSLLPPHYPSGTFLYTALSLFVSATVLRRLTIIHPNLTAQRESLNNLFIEIEPIMEVSRKYCEMLSGSIPNSFALLAYSKMILGSYLLGLHWRVTESEALETMPIPTDFYEGICRFFNLLLDDVALHEKMNPQMLQTLRMASTTTLQDIGKLVHRSDQEFFETRRKEVKAALPFSCGEDKDHNPDPAVLQLVRNEVCTVRPPPLSSTPEQLQNRRIRDWAKVMEQVFKGLAMEGPKRNNDPFSPPIYTLHRLVEEYAKKPPPTLNSLLKRLNTLSSVQQECALYFGRCTKEYESIIAATGAPTPALVEVWKSVDKISAKVVNEVYEWTAFCILLESGAYESLTHSYMVTDQKAYHLAKKKSKNSLQHYPKLFPDVTIDTIIRQLENTFTLSVKLLQKKEMADQILNRLGLFLVAMLYGTYVENKDVFLTPEDSTRILQDLNSVETFFDEASDPASKKRRNNLELSFTEKGTASAMLEELRRIVTFVMSQSSADLISGSDGAPPYNTLPEFTSQSPWCKYIVRKVLLHRRDKASKQFVS